MLIILKKNLTSKTDKTAITVYLFMVEVEQRWFMTCSFAVHQVIKDKLRAFKFKTNLIKLVSFSFSMPSCFLFSYFKGYIIITILDHKHIP